MLRVLYLFGESTGGIANYIRGLTKENSDYNFLVYPSKEEEDRFARRFPGYFRMRFQYRGSLLFVLLNLWGLSRRIKRNRIELINAHALKFGVYMIVLRLLLPRKIRFVYTDHGSPYLQTKSWFKRAFLFLIELLVTLCSDMRICIRENEFIVWKSKSNKTALVPTRVNLPNLKKKITKGTSTKVIMVGTIYDLKNPLFFKDVAKHFECSDNVNFSWIGPEGSDASLNQIITQSNVLDYLGEMEFQDVQSVMREADILLLSSKVEVTPLVMFEAFSSDTLVISNDWLGVDSFITHGSNGFIQKEVKRVVDVIDSYSRNKDEFKSITSRAKDNATSKFSNLEEFRNEYFRVLYG